MNILKSTSTLILGFCLFFLHPSIAAAQDGGGWVRAEIDGDAMEWELWPMQSEWFGSAEDLQGAISFYTRTSIDGVLPSTFRLSANRAEQNWYSTEVDLDLTDGQGHYTTGNVGDAKIDILEMSMDGNLMILKGTFSAVMFYKEQLSSQPDMTRSLVVKDATFEVQLPPRR